MGRKLSPESEEYLDHLLVERGLSENTVSAYRRDLHFLEDFLGRKKMALADLTYPAFTSFIIELRERLAPVSVARLVSAVSGLIRFQLQEGRLSRHPLPELETPRLEKNLPRVLSREEVGRLLEAPDDSPVGIRDRAMLEMLYATGMRVSELVSLRMEGLDLRERLVLVDGKGGRQRLVPFGAPAAGALEKYLARRAVVENAPAEVFLGRSRRALSRQSAWKAIRRAALKAGLEGRVYPHILRHSFASHFLEGGAGIRAVQEVLGHRSLSTTQIYTHLDGKRLSETHRRYHPRP